MAVTLPPELAGLLARTGHRWPDADEDQLVAMADGWKGLQNRLVTVRDEQGTVAEQIRQCTELIGTAEQLVADAVANGLLAEGADPVKQDSTLAQTAESAQSTRDTADTALEIVGSHIAEQQQARSAAHSRVFTAIGEAKAAERDLESINKRVSAICGDGRLLDIVGDLNEDPWAERQFRSDSLQGHAERADSDANDARRVLTAAQRTIDSVGADGLLPPSHLAEDIAERCQSAELPAWPGWRWLADTMAPGPAATFATARPDIVSGVVIGHPDLVDRAIDVIGDVDLDVALWIGAVIDPSAAQHGDNDNATQAQVLLPPAGIYDRDSAAHMVATATEKKAEATELLRTAKQRAEDARAALAILRQLWADLPNDPRSELAEKITAAKQRQHDAEADEQAAKASFERFDAERRDWQRQRNEAQQRMDVANETRLRLAPVIAAQAQAATAQAQLPGLRESGHDLRIRVGESRAALATLASDIEDAKEQTRIHGDRHQDAIEALRSAGLSPTTEGAVPIEAEATIRAQLTAIESALGQATIDPELHAEITRIRNARSDATARLGSDAELRAQAEQLAGTEGARHPVALIESVRLAKEREAHAREEFAKAAAAAEAAGSEYRQKVEDRADRSSPDVEGFPPAELVADEGDAERYAIRLDGLATQLGERQRTEERLAKEAETAIHRAEAASKLVEASVKPLRHLANAAWSGRRADDIDLLIEQITTISERVRTTRVELSASEHDQTRHANAIRAHANGPQARKVEDREDPRVVDLILRLRADDQLPAEAERIAGHLEQRAATLRDDLNNHDQHVRTCATMLQVQAATAIQRLRAYQNQSRLPDGLGDWTDRRFVVIEHDQEPADESVAVDRVARIVHALLTPGAARSDAKTMLFAAARALVDAPFRVRLLKPHIDLTVDRVDVAELKNFSGGQRVTAGVLLYATMTRVRAVGDATSIGWLWLDNPFGQASADQFVRTMRLVADKLGLQLVFTAAPKDKGALSMFDRIITLSKRSRPSSGEKVVIVDDKAHEIADLTLIQKDVLAVLGE